MPVVKGGVWSNIEDEILKSAVSKYGLNQWARVSSLLARKTPKQCKARWSEWIDPNIRKVEWSKEEDERLLHLAKIMPTQWRSIAHAVGRTATQSLERYQKLLDEAETRETDELSLGGPTGGETAAPSADDVRRLRPGELDPDPESKPARPDTIDLDEDEKEMLSEARARLANTQGKKAKRKARERQLEESRRLAVLQKRRELKSAGINIKVVTRKPGQMDYNADIPFEKAPAPGFFDTQDEDVRNEREREMFDPRKQQLATKRKTDQQDGDEDDRKRRKNEKSDSSTPAAAQRAGQMQKIREAERNSKRRALVLPTPQVGENELEDIVKMGMTGERAARIADGSANENTKGLIGNYSGMVGATPIRTPRAAPEEDRIANEVRNARARTETKSALLGGENTPLHEAPAVNGTDSSTRPAATPNPMAAQYREAMAKGLGATPRGAGATPLRTPRDNFRLNDQTPSAVQIAGQTPREVKAQEQATRNALRSQLAALPKPKATEWELDLPEEQDEGVVQRQLSEEDAALRDRRERDKRQSAEREDFGRQTQVLQKSLPRPGTIDVNAMMRNADGLSDPVERVLAKEAALLIANDAVKFGRAKIQGASTLERFKHDELDRARIEIALEAQQGPNKTLAKEAFDAAWVGLHSDAIIPGLGGYAEDKIDEQQLLTEAFDDIQNRLGSLSTSASATEKKLGVHLGGYQQRSKVLRQKLANAAESLDSARIEVDTKRFALSSEEAAVSSRLEDLRGEVETVMRRERLAQELFRERKTELESLGGGMVNGWH